MEIPRELRWIGPLFIILCMMLWFRGDPLLIFAMMMSVLIYIIYIPHVLVQMILFLVGFLFLKRNRFTILIFGLCYFISGIILEAPPITGTFPSPLSPIPNLYLTPSLSVLQLYIFIFNLLRIETVFFLTIPLFLSILTAGVTHFLSYNRVDAVLGMLFFVIIILFWILFPFPFLGFLPDGYSITPVPLGPLVALNLIPFMKSDEQPVLRLD